MDSIRITIDQLVSRIQPHDELEKEHIEWALKWIRSGADLFRMVKPATPNIHLVSYFLSIDPQEQQVLLVDHKKASLWLPAGGHVEVGEHPKETVEREIIEELSISADFLFPDPLFLTVTKTQGEEDHIDVSLWFALKGSISQSLNFDREEFFGVRWFKPAEIPYSRSDPHMLRFIKKMEELWKE